MKVVQFNKNLAFCDFEYIIILHLLCTGHVVACMCIANFVIFDWNCSLSWKRYAMQL